MFWPPSSKADPDVLFKAEREALQGEVEHVRPQVPGQHFSQIAAFKQDLHWSCSRLLPVSKSRCLSKQFQCNATATATRGAAEMESCSAGAISHYAASSPPSALLQTQSSMCLPMVPALSVGHPNCKNNPYSLPVVPALSVRNFEMLEIAFYTDSISSSQIQLMLSCCCQVLLLLLPVSYHPHVICSVTNMVLLQVEVGAAAGSVTVSTYPNSTGNTTTQPSSIVWPGGMPRHAAGRSS